MDTLFYLIDEQTTVHATFIVVTASLSSLFRLIYRVYDSRANAVSTVPTYQIDDNLVKLLQKSPNKCIDYAAIYGYVGTKADPLKSHSRSDITGVANLRTTSEVKEKWLNFSKSWQNEDVVIARMFESMPFHLHGKNSKNPFVLVENATDSEWFDDTLEVVSEEFTPKSDNNLIESVINLTNGERLRGYSDTEKMLQIGANILAIGEVRLDDDGIKIRAPGKAIYEYIVTRKSPSDIISHMRHFSTVWKFLSVVACGATVVSSYYFIRRLRSRYLELQDKRQQRTDMELIRRRRSQEPAPSPDCCRYEENLCVVCLVNPRECVLLDCGHICLCADCLELLPRPLTCPVCREHISRCLPVYNV